MRLAEFIDQNRERIIEQWVAFARTLLPWAKGLGEAALRDHAEELLTAVVSDMERPQTTVQRSEKSRGEGLEGALARVAHAHASQRLDSGFDIEQLASEYRALRASILQLWDEADGGKQGDVTRFNEAIDESLTESIVRYSAMVSRTREQFLAILGHDLRNPLGAVIMGATFLTTSEGLSDQDIRVAARILNSAAHMKRMVSDLLDLTRTRLGSGIPVLPRPMDLRPVCEHVIAELGAVHPECPVAFTSVGDLLGEWDSDRLRQVLTNLIGNALQYNGTEAPVSVAAEGEQAEVVVRINNRGTPISERAMHQIFDPMIRDTAQHGGANPGGLGLGLYIAREVVLAHRGTIEVSSSERDGTTFTVRIPRSATAKS